MAFPSENFDSYAHLDSLNGKSGGSGWSGNWDEFDPEGGSNITNTQAQSGTLSMTFYSDSGGAYGARRDFSNQTTGQISMYVRSQQASGPVKTFSLGEGTTMRMQVRLSGSNVDVNNNGTWDNITTFSINTWYQLQFKIISTTTYQVAWNGGSFSADKTIVGGSFTNINRLQFEASQVAGGHNSFIDTIADDSPAAAAEDPLLMLTGIGAN